MQARHQTDDATPPAKPQYPTGRLPEARKTLRVLAAEDTRVNQLVLRVLLEQAGVEPTIVDDGAAALAAWREGPWDLILMDVQMPVMDGVAATRAIRAEEISAGAPRTPILALTADATPYQLAEYVAAGMDSLVPKPIKVEELFTAIQTVLDARDAL